MTPNPPGSSTGLWHSKQNKWQSSQRERVHLLANMAVTPESLAQTTPVLIQDSSTSVLDIVPYPTLELNKRFFDVGFASDPVECDEADGTCDEMKALFAGTIKDAVEPAAASKYRYALDLDGNSWSSRFRRLLTSGR